MKPITVSLSFSRSIMLGGLALVCALALSNITFAKDDISALWNERIKSVVGVGFYVDAEQERQQIYAFGTVIDDLGTVIFSAQSIGEQVAPAQLGGFRVYLPGATISHFYSATYVGQDELTGWHFLRITDTNLVHELVPITRYRAETIPRVAQEIWGIGLKKKDEDFVPYFLSSRVSIIQRLPQHVALAAQEVTGLGLPAFDQEGAFVGLGTGGFGQTFLQFSGLDRGGLPIVLINPDECAAILLADEVFPFLDRIPTNMNGRPKAWLGSNGLQPIDPDVAQFLGLKEQAGLVVGEVLENSPAAKAGMRERDILLSVDGQAFPILKPDRVLVTYFQREVDRRLPDDTLRLGILRDGDRLELKVTLTDAPELPREAPRQYFEDLGLSVRRFTYTDGVARRLKLAQHRGVIVNFVKSNAPISTSGLMQDDWIQEVNGAVILHYEDAVRILEAIEKDPGHDEFRVMVERGGEAKMLTIKFN